MNWSTFGGVSFDASLISRAIATGSAPDPSMGTVILVGPDPTRGTGVRLGPSPRFGNVSRLGPNPSRGTSIRA